MPIVRADASLCQAYANCVVAAPDHFDLDDDGVVMLLKADFPESQRAYVENAVRSCPVAALRVEEDA